MRDFYEAFYTAVKDSIVHALFCERAFGRNLCQHGFADLAQLEALIQVTGLGPDHHTLDLGCGNGMIAEYLSDRTGAHVTGLDYIPEAIRQAQERTRAKAGRLAFRVGDLNTIDLPARAFDVILLIDTLYFSTDYARTIRELTGLLRSDGQLALLFSHGWEPGMPADAFPADTLLPERTPLGEALMAHGLPFRTWDFTESDCRLARKRKQILEELQPAFLAEGLGFVYDNRMGECDGIGRGCQLGLHRRYLYQVGPTSSSQGSVGVSAYEASSWLRPWNAERKRLQSDDCCATMHETEHSGVV